MNIDTEKRSALTVEIFKATGLSVDETDPVVIVALMQSYYMRQAGTDVIKQIESSTHQALRSLESMIASTAQQVAQQTSNQIVSAINDATHAETSRLKTQLTNFADSLKVKLSVRRSTAPEAASEEGDSPISRKAVFRMTCGIALVAIFGVLFGASCFGKQFLEPNDKQQLQLGKTMWRIWPALSTTAKNEITRAIQNPSN